MKPKREPTKAQLIGKLKRLCKQWRKKSKEYQLAAMQGRKVDPEEIEASRYEGESSALRWCANDLEAFLMPASRWVD